MRLSTKAQGVVCSYQLQHIHLHERMEAVNNIVSEIEWALFEFIPKKSTRHVIYRIDGDNIDSNPDWASGCEGLAYMITARLAHPRRQRVQFSIEVIHPTQD